MGFGPALTTGTDHRNINKITNNLIQNSYVVIMLICRT